jgi:hypothetical protein
MLKFCSEANLPLVITKYAAVFLFEWLELVHFIN